MIRFEKVRKVFPQGGREIVALDDLSLEIGKGEFVVVNCAVARAATTARARRVKMAASWRLSEGPLPIYFLVSWADTTHDATHKTWVWNAEKKGPVRPSRVQAARSQGFACAAARSVRVDVSSRLRLRYRYDAGLLQAVSGGLHALRRKSHFGSLLPWG